VLWFGARLVVENRLSPGELSTFVIYAVYVGSNVGQLAGVVSSLVQVYHHVPTLCPALPGPALPKASAYPVSAPAHQSVSICAVAFGVEMAHSKDREDKGSVAHSSLLDMTGL